MKKYTVPLGALGTVLITLWLGLKIEPPPFPTFPERTPSLETVKLPSDLPAPVARYYRTIVGDRVPIIESAVISGRGTLRVFGLRFPARFRFVHCAGQGYWHDIEATWFGLPVMQVNESYQHGQARMVLPVGVIENEPKIDMAANLALWGESLFWLPSILVTESRVQWDPIDDTSAQLTVPFGDESDVLTVTFDTETGLLQTMGAMRYRDAADTSKTPWRGQPLDWQNSNKTLIPSPAALTWLDERTPWSIWTVEEIVYNVNIHEYTN